MLAALSDSFMVASRMDGFSYLRPAYSQPGGPRRFAAWLRGLLLPAV